MNKSILLTAASVLFSLSLTAGLNDVPDTGKDDIVYCALLKSGKMMLVAEGKQVFTDVKLKKGIRVTTDGTVIYPDGSKIYLKNGECINYEGNIFDFSNMDNNKVKENNTKKL